MQFSMIFEAQTADPSRDGEFRAMHDCVERAVLAERVGFDRVNHSMFNPNHAYGSADDAARYVARLVEAGADELMFLIQMGRCRRRPRSRRSASSERR